MGFAAENELKTSGKRATEKQVIDMKIDCRNFWIKTVKKLIEKAPVKYTLMRLLSCIDPRYMAENRYESVLKMKKILKLHVDAKRINGDLSICDDLMREYTEFVDTQWYLKI